MRLSGLYSLSTPLCQRGSLFTPEPECDVLSHLEVLEALLVEDTESG
jgi:hypothetical protein